MSTLSDTPQTDAVEYEVFDDYDCGVNVVSSSLARKLERERNEWKSLAAQYSAEREHNAMQALAYKADRDEARADAIRWQSIAEGRGRTDDEAENDTQAELAAWEMLEIARRERDQAIRQLTELQDRIVMESDTKKPLRETSNKLEI